MKKTFSEYLNQEKEKYIQNMNNHVPYQYVTIDRDSDKDTLPVQK